MHHMRLKINNSPYDKQLSPLLLAKLSAWSRTYLVKEQLAKTTLSAADPTIEPRGPDC